MEELNGKVALVTGGGRGLGEAIVRTLGAAGVRVVIGDVRTDLAGRVAEDLTAAGCDATAMRFDVSDENQVDAGIREIAQKFGQLDILVNNAGTDVTIPIG